MNRRVSVANLQQTPWIPGQQLFGVMIPRPEHEAKTFDAELERQQCKLDAFKRAVEQLKRGEKPSLYKRLSSKLGSDSIRYEVIAEGDENELRKAISESDGSTLGELEKPEASKQEEEEGLEIVGLGRYSTLDDCVQDDEREILTTKSCEAVLERQDSKLSSMYKSSEKVEVAFYRPLEHIPSDLDESTHLPEQCAQ